MQSKINEKAIDTLYAYRFWLTRQQFKTLRGQILAGEDKAAMKGLEKLMQRRKEEQ